MSWENPKPFIKVGKEYNYPQSGCIVKKIHILAEINDDGYKLIVYKRYSPTKQRYWYHVEPRHVLDWLAEPEQGAITKLK